MLAAALAYALAFGPSVQLIPKYKPGQTFMLELRKIRRDSRAEHGGSSTTPSP